MAAVARSRIITVRFWGRWIKILWLSSVFWAAAIFLGFVAIQELKNAWNLMFPESAVHLVPNTVALGNFISAFSGLIIVLTILSPSFLFVPWVRRRIITNVAKDMSQQRTSFRFAGLLQSNPLFERQLKGISKDEVEMQESPYILCRGACHRAHTYTLPLITKLEWFRDPVERRQGASFDISKHTLLDSLNDMLALRIGRVLNTDVNPVFGEGSWFTDVVTNTDSQKSILDDGGDLPLRYVQSTPQNRFIDYIERKGELGSSQFTDGERPKAKYVIILCLTNAIREPICVLPVAAVVRKLREKYGEDAKEYLATLEKRVTPLFWRINVSEQNGNISDDVLEFYLRNERQVVAPIRGGYGAGFDANRVDYSAMNDRIPARKALFAFSQAISEAARRDEVEITLKAGDVLIINNYYGLHRRKEMQYKSWRRPLFMIPRRRWLRIYCAFSRLKFS